MLRDDPDFIIHFKLDDIGDDEWRTFIRDENSEPPQPYISCIDFFVKEASSIEWRQSLQHDFVINPDFIRFAAGNFADATVIVGSLGPGGELHRRLARVHEALDYGRGDLIGACQLVSDFLYDRK